MKNWTTPKGTVLPLLNLRGKDYLQVAHRLVWFREEHPGWTIETEFLVRDEAFALAKAVIKDDAGRLISMAHKQEDRKGFADFIEKAETGAIGRALALCGFGTQFCADEIETGLVDAPLPPQGTKRPAWQDADWDTPAQSHDASDAGEYVVNFGKQYKGKKLNEIGPEKIASTIGWIETEAKPEFAQSKGAQEFLKFAKEFLNRHRDAQKRGAE